MENNILALIVAPGKRPKAQVIENTLRALQTLVDGQIEAVPAHCADEKALLICNEEGKLRNLAANFKQGGDLICGTAVFVGYSGEDFCSLSTQALAELLRRLTDPYKRLGSALRPAATTTDSKQSSAPRKRARSYTAAEVMNLVGVAGAKLSAELDDAGYPVCTDEGVARFEGMVRMYAAIQKQLSEEAL